MSRQLELAAGTRDIYYCPGNFQNRTAREWWPYMSGTIAVTYQFPFWLKDTCWLIPILNYRQSDPEAVLAADFLGSNPGGPEALVWNHKRRSDGWPVGMNMLLSDGHVEWRDYRRGFLAWGRSAGPIDWYWANP
jgi:hypothetical protein